MLVFGAVVHEAELRLIVPVMDFRAAAGERGSTLPTKLHVPRILNATARAAHKPLLSHRVARGGMLVAETGQLSLSVCDKRPYVKGKSPTPCQAALDGVAGAANQLRTHFEDNVVWVLSLGVRPFSSQMSAASLVSRSITPIGLHEDMRLRDCSLPRSGRSRRVQLRQTVSDRRRERRGRANERRHPDRLAISSDDDNPVFTRLPDRT